MHIARRCSCYFFPYKVYEAPEHRRRDFEKAALLEAVALQVLNMTRPVILKPLKTFARIELKDCPIIRSIILEGPETITAEEFIVKSKLWLQVLGKDIELKTSGQLRQP